MQHRFSPIAFVAAVLAALIVPASVHAEAASYKIDPSHSSVMFRSRHADTSYVWGRFNKFSGTITYDTADPSKLAIDTTIDVASVDTAEPKRDAHLKSPDFFSAKEFPTITFKTNGAKSAGGDSNKFELTGDVTLHGQTKPITLTLEKVGASNGQMGDRVGWTSTFTVKRSDFGMSGMIPMIGDEVQLIVSVETVKAK